MFRSPFTYGLDAPGVVRGLALGGVACLGARALIQGPLGTTLAWTGGVLLLEAAAMAWTSLGGKRLAARQLLRAAALTPEARVLDVGCGRGLLLVEAARLLTQGEATGLDIWQVADLSGNARAATEARLQAAGVAARTRLVDAPAQAMPLPEGTFDVVVSSLCLHNLPTSGDRDQALAEIARVLRPGGRVLLQDFRHTADYASTLTSLGFVEVRRALVNPLLMFPPTWRVTARKP